jgi:hypothetical protein
MSRLYAILDNNIVTSISPLEEEQVISISMSTPHMLIDIQDLPILPSVGWILSGNRLVAPPTNPVPINIYINSKIKQFQDMAPALLRDMYVANTLAGITTAQSDAMFDDYQDVLSRVREGAWPTAVYRLYHKQPTGFVTQEMITSWINLLLSRMQ